MRCAHKNSRAAKCTLFAWPPPPRARRACRGLSRLLGHQRRSELLHTSQVTDRHRHTDTRGHLPCDAPTQTRKDCQSEERRVTGGSVCGFRSPLRLSYPIVHVLGSVYWDGIIVLGRYTIYATSPRLTSVCVCYVHTWPLLYHITISATHSVLKCHVKHTRYGYLSDPHVGHPPNQPRPTHRHSLTH